MIKRLIGSFVLAVVTMGTGLALATDGDPRGCHNIMISFPAIGGGQAQSVSTDAFICVVERNMRRVDEMVATGEITITVYSRRTAQPITVYQMGASMTDGAAGSIYTVYGKTVDDLTSSNGEENYNNIVFGMRNDHLSRGDYAGHVRMPVSGLRLDLQQR